MEVDSLLCHLDHINATRDSNVICVKSILKVIRRWSKMLKKPIFSVDYRLAPKFPFPAALDDCWQAYNWIIDNAEETLG